MRARWGCDPMYAAAEIEEQERREAKLLAGTGCDTCQNAVTGFGITVCDIKQTHPKCVFRGRYKRAEP